MTLLALLVGSPRTAAAVPLCSARAAVCVDANNLEALALAEQAYATLEVLGLPRPAQPLQLVAPPALHGCALETSLHRAVLSASLQSTGGHAAELEALTASLLELSTPCGDLLARASQQADAERPERGWPRRGPGFLSWLDARYSVAGPGRLLSALSTRLQLADLFAVLRDNLRGAEFSRSTFADTVAAFGLRQALDREAKAAWSIPWPTTPRGLLLSPLEPLGTGVIEVEVPASTRSSLRVEASWEQHAEMRLAIVALDASRTPLQTSWVASRPRIAEANTTFVLPEGARWLRVLVVHVDDPFDPLSARAAAFEPHAAVVNLAAQP